MRERERKTADVQRYDFNGVVRVPSVIERRPIRCVCRDVTARPPVHKSSRPCVNRWPFLGAIKEKTFVLLLLLCAPRVFCT
jgi:hypothetical protein